MKQKIKSRARDYWEWSKESENGYWLTRFLFLRVLGFTYFFAFLSLFNQLMPLLGSGGLTPVQNYMTRVNSFSSFIELPTVFWLSQNDSFMIGLALLGVLISFLLMIGYANVPMLFINWFIYLSFVNVGQIWYSYGWEIQLLETGFLAIFFVPLINPRPFPSGTPPSKLLIWLLRWIAVRVNLGSGLIKVKGSECWRKLTCLDRFFNTQPIPNPLSPLMHHLPPLLHKAGVLYTHVIQIFAPFTALFENQQRKLRIYGGLLLLSLQFILVFTGNLAFLNWITIASIIGFFDDRFLSRFMPERIVKKAEEAKENAEQISTKRNAINILLVVFVALMSIPVVVNLLSPYQAMNTSFNNWNLVNSYGAFGSVREARTELVMEGTRAKNPENARWKEYDFPAKPDQPGDPLPVVAPYQPRIAWQMWFASMSQPEREPWLLHFTWKLLHNDPEALKLVKHNPFPDRPPRYIRIQIYRYELEPPLEEKTWERQLIGTWMPPVSKNSTRIKNYIDRRYS